jgi:glycine dehydrogenase subunit 1
VHVPSAVAHVTGAPAFYTAYTPYQAEASQGTLQAIYEFQTLISRLTAMDVANASLYDGSTAAAEAALVAVGATRRDKVVVASSAAPGVRAAVRTYLSSTGVTVVEVPLDGGTTCLDALAGSLESAAAIIVQHPNFFGCLEPVAAVSEAAREAGAMLISVVDPLSLSLLKPPGEYGADIAVGEGQSLGSPMGYGGPLLGFLATSRKHVRRIPGRIIGATEDADGRRGYVMTLQTREQHIRRARATSNICTNQALVALGATVYMSLLGTDGLRELAKRIAATARYAAAALGRIDGVRLKYDRPFFREFVVEVPLDAHKLKAELSAAGIWPGISCGCYYEGLENCLLVSVSERHSRHDVDVLASGVEAVLSTGGGK